MQLSSISSASSSKPRFATICRSHRFFFFFFFLPHHSNSIVESSADLNNSTSLTTDCIVVKVDDQEVSSPIRGEQKIFTAAVAIQISNGQQWSRVVYKREGDDSKRRRSTIIRVKETFVE
ncbi:unnamed protein product [Linum trigynum]|uniref:Uncharacterized protein n=1 Tax=Linum trigynum TaxID=586398 RepID=A0AAV2DTT4_9ROSI